MKQARRISGFTLAEVLIGMVGSMIVVGALLAGSIGMQKSFHASETYADSQADQRRLTDYLTRDLRRAIGVATATGDEGVSTKLVAGTVTVDEDSTLVITLPAYYRSNTPTDTNYDQPLPLVASGDNVAYGSTTGPAPGYTVSFRKVILGVPQCVCLVREEAGVQQVVVRNAEDLQVQVTVAADGKSCVVSAQFQSSYGRDHPVVAASDQVMLRNIRID